MKPVKHILILSAILALASAGAAAAQTLDLGDTSGGIVSGGADREDGSTDAMLGSGDSLFTTTYGSDQESGSLAVGELDPNLGDPTNLDDPLALIDDLGDPLSEDPMNLAALPNLTGGEGTDPDAGIDFTLRGSGGASAGSDDPLAFLADLIAAGDCAAAYAGGEVTIVPVQALIPASSQGQLGGVLAGNASAIMRCQLDLGRVASLLGISPQILNRVVAVDVRGGSILIFTV